MTAYKASITRRKRRSPADMRELRAAIYDIVEEDFPMTCRGVFYRLVGTGLVQKTENEYNNTVIRMLTKMRIAEILPWGWITDNTRWMRRPLTYSSAEQALRSTAQFYRRALWDNQDAYVEVWCEKDALLGVLHEVTSQFDVPLMVCRGFSSLTFLYTAAETISAVGKPTYIYYLGDYDPKGMQISANVEKRLREFAPGAEIHFKRLAVTPEQIEELKLPTRPTKKATPDFQGRSVEVDTIPSEILREMVTDHIVGHIDVLALNITKVAEDSERRILAQMAASWT